jgi:hypothetical protein
MGMVLGAQPFLIEQGLLPVSVAAGLGWFYAGGAALALAGVVALSAHWAWKEFPSKSISAWAAWGLILMLVFIFPFTRGSLARSSVRPEAVRLGDIVEEKPLFWLVMPQSDREGRLDPGMIFYLNRPLIPLEAGNIRQAVDQHAEFFLLAPQGVSPQPGRMTPVTTLGDQHLQLWRSHALP